MAKLVIGNNKTVGVPVITKEIEKLPALGLMRAKSENGKLIASTTESQIIDFTGVSDVSENILSSAYAYNNVVLGNIDMSDLTTLSGTNACSSMFRQCSRITGVDLGSLTTVSGTSACQYMFNGCTGITSIDISSLTTVGGGSACMGMFSGCAGITSVDLSSLTTMSGSNACNAMFSYCTGLTSVDMSSLTTISNTGSCSYMFSYCTGITSVDMSGLITISGSAACGNMFQGCTSLTTVRIGDTTAIDFGTRTNQFGAMFSGCTQNIDVYAPAASQSKIESFSGYPNFGATGTVTWHWNTAE